CSLLHNYQEQDHDQLFHPKFSALLKKSPSFTARHIQDLQAYIRKYIQRGDQQAILVEIEHGKIKPSKSLQDSLSSMLKGNQEFIMLDEQKVVYEQALYLARLCQKDSKRRFLIIKGGFI
ncbi:MAG: ATP-binding protein, partial [Clostridiales bacterium]|nr:ATP-binding protein [Clostridiales bacterium]